MAGKHTGVVRVPSAGVVQLTAARCHDRRAYQALGSGGFQQVMTDVDLERDGCLWQRVTAAPQKFPSF